MTAITPIIRLAISSDVRRFPHMNMEKKGISQLSRDGLNPTPILRPRVRGPGKFKCTLEI
jgi:hypothetical protein